MSRFGEWTPTSEQPVTSWASGEQWICTRASDEARAVVTVLAYPSPTNASRLQHELDTLAALRKEGAGVPEPLGSVGSLPDGRPFAAVRDVDGVHLDAYTEDLRLGPDQVLAIGAKVARTLALAHARDLFHRDVRPANIVLEVATGEVVLVGWGQASDRCLPGRHAVDAEARGPSPRYAPPEAIPDPVPTDPEGFAATVQVARYQADLEALAVPRGSGTPGWQAAQDRCFTTLQG
ncbi:MAG: hypothetical protein KC656_33965, partial [Myxococcales bacterium]|nr:hypothetical protein [Myxococcales bacterium]